MNQHNIVFNKVKTSGISLVTWPLILKNQKGPSEGGGSGIINAVDIDWNGAALGLINGINFGEINTTLDLLNAFRLLANTLNGTSQDQPFTLELFKSIKTNGVNLVTWPIILKGQQGPDSNGGRGVINAVDIDWNKAQLGTIGGINFGTINTTWDFFNAIKQLAQAIYDKKHSSQPTTTYTASFNLSGGSGSVNPISAAAGSTITLPSYNGTKPSTDQYDYTFANKWMLNGTTIYYEVGSTYTLNSNVTFAASWNAIPKQQTTYTITFKDGSNTLHTITGPTGTAVTTPTNPSKTGYTFIGWNTNSSATTAATVITTIGTSNITYYAIWTQQSQTTYKYYAGVTDKVSFTISDLTQSTTTKPTTLTFTAAPAGTNNYQTFVYPSSWGKPTSMIAGGLDGKDGWFWGTDAGMESLPSGYTAAVAQGGAVTYTVTW